MRLRFIIRLLVLILVGQFICQAQTPKSDKHTALVKKAQSLVENLAKQDYAGATKNFNDEMKNRLTVAKLDETWKIVLSQAGAFKKQLSAESSQVKEGDKVYDVVVVKCEFERAALNVRVVFDSSDHVAGLFFAAA